MTDDSKVEIVRSCLAASEAFETARMLQHFSEGAVLWNAPIPPVRGKAKIEKVLDRLFAACTSLEVTVHHIASNESTVLMERTDTICVRGVHVSVPIAGAVYFEGEEIVAWRDYFDLLHLLRQLTLQSGRRVLGLLVRA